MDLISENCTLQALTCFGPLTSIQLQEKLKDIDVDLSIRECEKVLKKLIKQDKVIRTEWENSDDHLFKLRDEKAGVVGTY